MEGQNNKTVKIVYIILILGFIAGVIGLGLQTTRPFMQALTPFFLLFSSIAVYFFEYKTLKSKQLLIWMLISFSVGILIEIIGVNTKLIFGDYSYGETLGLKIFSTPIIIGINWITVALGTFFLTSQISNKFLAAALAGLASVIFDLPLEFVAIKLDFWNWASGFNVPLQNYIAWFFVTFILVYIGRVLKIKLNSKLTRDFFLMQFCFFIALNFVLRL